jgi:hypothetical protein
MTTQVFYTQPGVINGEIKPIETELEFVKWTPSYLIVKYPENSQRAGENWAMGRKLVNHWLKLNILRIEGNIPEWALVK